MILAPIVRPKTEHEETPKEVSRAIARFRAAFVFERLSRDLRLGFCPPMQRAARFSPPERLNLH